MNKIKTVMMSVLFVFFFAGVSYGMEFHDVHAVCVSPAGAIITSESEGDGLAFKSAPFDNPGQKKILDIDVPDTAEYQHEVYMTGDGENGMRTFTSYKFDLFVSPEGDFFAVRTFAQNDNGMAPAFLYVYGLKTPYRKIVDLKDTGMDFDGMWFVENGRLLFSGKGRSHVYDIDSGKSEDIPGESFTMVLQYLKAKDMLIYLAKKEDSEEPGIFVKSPLMSPDRKYIGELKQVTEKTETENFSGSFSYDVPVFTDAEYNWILEGGMEYIPLFGFMEFYSFYPEVYKKIAESFPMCGRFTFILFGEGRHVVLFDSFTNTVHVVDR